MRDDIEQRINTAAMLVNTATEMLKVAKGEMLEPARRFGKTALDNANAMLITELRVPDLARPAQPLLRAWFLDGDFWAAESLEHLREFLGLLPEQDASIRPASPRELETRGLFENSPDETRTLGEIAAACSTPGWIKLAKTG